MKLRGRSHHLTKTDYHLYDDQVIYYEKPPVKEAALIKYH